MIETPKENENLRMNKPEKSRGRQSLMIKLMRRRHLTPNFDDKDQNH